MTQKDVDTFADVTGDHQWIHVDVERAKETPFGGTIAHGYLTLSLGPALNNQVFKLEGFAFALNYGLNKVRFPAPVPIPSNLRVSPKVKEVTDIPGGAQVVFEVSFEREGTEKPVCVAETVVRVYDGLAERYGGARGALKRHAVGPGDARRASGRRRCGSSARSRRSPSAVPRSAWTRSLARPRGPTTVPRSTPAGLWTNAKERGGIVAPPDGSPSTAGAFSLAPLIGVEATPTCRRGRGGRAGSRRRRSSCRGSRRPPRS